MGIPIPKNITCKKNESYGHDENLFRLRPDMPNYTRDNSKATFLYLTNGMLNCSIFLASYQNHYIKNKYNYEDLKRRVDR